ncbi:hypothetical protein [Tetragenococcus halophilus]|uniref:hypothetical protein n=1 Tax=Tetragenococcus halophilus TaxID=51669 RepID=UPI00209B01E5|nr:hypothetical protein [Tetragenococcus halophilus]MCO8294672.1 hypothetical protein [Tetragenococcus halophilus]
MDKQKCLEILNQKIDEAQEETDRSPEGSSYGTLMLGRKQAFSDVRGLLKTLDEPEITTEQAWEKIAEKFEEGPKELCATLVSALPPYNLSEKPEIPHWLAERTEEYNIDSSVKFWRYVFNGSIFDPEERAWILDNDDIINKIFLCGYTVKELAWVVKINKKVYFCRFTDKYFKENSDEPTYSESGNPSLIKKFTNKDKAKAEAVATLVDGEVEEWSE